MPQSKWTDLLESDVSRNRFFNVAGWGSRGYMPQSKWFHDTVMPDDPTDSIYGSDLLSAAERFVRTHFRRATWFFGDLSMMAFLMHRSFPANLAQQTAHEAYEARPPHEPVRSVPEVRTIIDTDVTRCDNALPTQADYTLTRPPPPGLQWRRQVQMRDGLLCASQIE